MCSQSDCAAQVAASQILDLLGDMFGIEFVSGRRQPTQQLRLL
jgi:phosphoribosylcarboxyaminoimidazole (NCAIR) mutase